MILGIDLGTSNSMAAVYKDGELVFIESSTGRRTIPSVVSMDERGVFYTGDVAKERKLNHPEYTVDMFKRSMGTDALFRIGEKEIRAEELSATLLRSIKEDAERFLGEEITEAVISVPAFFTNPQRKAVIRAGELAGFHVRKIINEPTAAALAYGIQTMQDETADCEREEEEEKVIMVLDLGGGTFDISIMEAGEDVMEVLAVCGDNRLGGMDFTRRLIELFRQANGIGEELSAEEEAVLWKQAEKAKYQISKEGRGEMCCKLRQAEYSYCITEEEYEKACFDLLEKIRKLTMKAVEESTYEANEVAEILMVGGGTKLSIVKKMMEKMAGKELDYQVNPDEAVVCGAAMQGAMLEKNKQVRDLVMTDVCPYYIGNMVISSQGYDQKMTLQVFIPKNATIPTKVTKCIEDAKSNSMEAILCQAGDVYGRDRVIIGKVSYVVPDTEKDGCLVQESMIYDSNGILHFEAYIPENGKRYQSTFTDDRCELNEEQVHKRLEELNYLNLEERENDINQVVLARAERLYCECIGQEREKIAVSMGEMEQALHSGKSSRIAEAREKLTWLLDMYDTEEYR